MSQAFAIIDFDGPVVQRTERAFPKRYVGGSIPSGAISGASPKTAAQRLLRLLYREPKPESPQGKDQAIRDVRNEEIRRRYEAGERVVDLAQEYGMTVQGIYRILRAGKH